MAKEDKAKRIFIAGAAAAINYKEAHPNASESEVMEHVSREMRSMIAEIERD